MKKEYITPDVEMMKFLESEEIMNGIDASIGITDDPFGVQG